jgi:hypothetical protein
MSRPDHLLIANGSLVSKDQAGERGDVLVAGERIAAVAPHIEARGGWKVIDATGMVVAPGFMNIHSHADFQAFHSGTDDHDEKTFDGFHMTIGHVNEDQRSHSARLMCGEKEMKLDLIESMSDKDYEYSKCPDHWLDRAGHLEADSCPHPRASAGNHPCRPSRTCADPDHGLSFELPCCAPVVYAGTALRQACVSRRELCSGPRRRAAASSAFG